MNERDEYLFNKFKNIPTQKIKRQLELKTYNDKDENEEELTRRLNFGKLAWILSSNGSIEITKEDNNE